MHSEVTQKLKSINIGNKAKEM